MSARIGMVPSFIKLLGIALLGIGLLSSALVSVPVHGQGGLSGQNGEGQREAPDNSGPVRLESIFVGDKEQPAVSYFVPWEGVGAPDKLYWNMEEKHDQSLGKVDREIMLRSIQLYQDLQLESPPR